MKNDYAIWITRDGVELEICKMESSHITNCINMLKRTVNIYKDEILFTKQQHIQRENLRCRISDKEIYIYHFEKELERRKKDIDKSTSVCYNKENDKKGEKYMKIEEKNIKIDHYFSKALFISEIMGTLGLEEGDEIKLCKTPNSIELYRVKKKENKMEVAKNIVKTANRLSGINFVLQPPYVIAISSLPTKQGLQETKTAVAICNKKDSFDAMVGKAIALKRLLGEKVPEILLK